MISIRPQNSLDFLSQHFAVAGILIFLLIITGSCTKDIDMTIPAISGKQNKEIDIAYTTPPGSDPKQTKLDIYFVPDQKPKQLMVFVHGGAWVGGDKDYLRAQKSFVNWFLDKGFVVAAINYRLASLPGDSNVVTFSDQLTDIAFALSWLNDNSFKYGVADDSVLLVGHSAGAHLVALLSTDTRYLKFAGFDPGKIKATISIDIHMYDVPFGQQLMEDSKYQSMIPFVKYFFGAPKEEQLFGSPAFYAPFADVPPCLIISAEPSEIKGSHGYITSQASKNYVQLLSSLNFQASWSHFDEETHISLVTNFGVSLHRPTMAVESFLAPLYARDMNYMDDGFSTISQ